MTLAAPRRAARAAALLLVATLAGACDACDGERFATLVPLITPSADALALGPTYVGATDSRAISLRSAGTAPLTLGAVRLEGDASLALRGSAAGTLQPGDTKALEVTFTPVAPGAFTATLVVESDAENDPELRVAVTAVALAQEPCDDDNECTVESFDPALGRCVTTFVSGPCDDGSACTTDDRCLDGACVGSAVSCAADNLCERGVCANDEGCLSLPDPDACDDDNPCTQDSCDPDAGCAHEAVADGTPCAPPAGCEEARVCLSGACVAVAVPDGTPCSDGDLCTVADRCLAGVCAGERVEREPEVVGTLASYGVSHSAGVVLDDGTLLFRDAASNAATTALNAVRVDDGALTATGHLPVDGNGRAWPAVALPGSRALLVVGPPPYRALVVEREESGALVELGSVALTVTGTPHFLAAHGDVVYGCGFPDLMVLDASDPAAPVVAGTLDGTERCRDLTVDGGSESLFLSLSSGGLFRYDLSAPLAPLLDGAAHAPDLLVAPVATAGGVLAAYESDAADPAGYVGVLPGAGGNLWLRSAATLAPLGEIPVDALERVLGLAFVDAGLVVVRGVGATVHVELWDVTDPAAPSLLDDELVWSVGTLAFAHARADLVVLARAEGSGAVFEVTAGGGLRRLRGATLGLVSRVAAHTGGVVTLSPDTVRSVAIADSTAPAVLAAATLPFDSMVVSLGPDRAPPTWMPRTTHFDVLSPLYASEAGTWLDASELEAPLAAGQTRFSPPAFRAGISSGTALYVVRRGPSTGTWAFEVFALDAPPVDDFELTLTPTGSVPLAFETNVNPVFASVAYDPLARRAAVVVNDHIQSAAHLALLDVADPAAPALLATRQAADRAVHGLGVAGDVLVATLMATGGAYQSYRSDRLVVMAAGPDGEIIDLGEVSLPADSGHLLAFDGRTAFVASRTGVVFVDVTAGSPSVIGTTTTSGPVIEAAFAADHLVVSQEAALETISPPCPPLP